MFGSVAISFRCALLRGIECFLLRKHISNFAEATRVKRVTTMTSLGTSRDVTCHRLWHHNGFSNSIQFELIYFISIRTSQNLIKIRAVLFIRKRNELFDHPSYPCVLGSRNTRTYTQSKSTRIHFEHMYWLEKKYFVFCFDLEKIFWLSDCEKKKSLVFYRKKIKRKSWGKNPVLLPWKSNGRSQTAMKTFIRKKMGHTTYFRLIEPHQWPFNDPTTKARGNILQFCEFQIGSQFKDWWSLIWIKMGSK